MPPSVSLQTVLPRWTTSGSLFGASRDCGLTATTPFCTDTRGPGAPILCDFGVEVTRTFEPAGEVYVTETPGGEAAVVVHRGPYSRMNEAHEAIRNRIAANRRESALYSCEIYGDPTPDPAHTETTIVYLVK
jgi:hypothetical protein